MSAEPKPEELSADPEAAAGRVPLRQLLAYALLELPVMGALNLMRSSSASATPSSG